MEPKLQGTNEIVIHAAPSQIWAVLEDPLRIPEYFPSVSSVEVDAGARERVGATRRCQVEMGGRRGEVVERCTEAVAERKLTHVMDKDPFGFSRLFADFGFSFVLEPQAAAETRVRIEGFYREKTMLSRAMNALMMRRKLSKLRARILANLKSLVETQTPS
jgi:carbon monoxide dehydrogenase subunit G